jgi:hypothetical protein
VSGRVGGSMENKGLEIIGTMMIREKRGSQLDRSQTRVLVGLEYSF